MAPSFKYRYNPESALLLLFLLFSPCLHANKGIRPVHLKCDYSENPTGVGHIPSFSWELLSDERNQVQTAYQILITENHRNIDKNIGETWNSGKVISDESIHIRTDKLNLRAGTAYYWKVKVWNRNDIESDWSAPAKFVTALFDTADWDNAQWISHENMPDSLMLVPGIQPWGRDVRHMAKKRAVVPLFRTEFNIKKKIQSAYLHISGLGHYKATINGIPVSCDFLSPGWTHYQKTCLYNTYEVTSVLKRGRNALGVIVGNGFYNISNERYRKLLITYGMPKMIAKLQINFADGTSKTVVSDTNWKSAPSPVTYSSIYGGENYDARMEQKRWNKPRFDDTNWNKVFLATHPGGRLTAETTYPVKTMECFDPLKITQTGKDTFLYDFGQNASGIIFFQVNGNKGDTIRLWPGELIHEDGRVDQGATGKPYYYEYILKGDGSETWRPLFTYYGFRYVQVEGAHPAGYESESMKPEIEVMRFLHTYNSAPHTGSFDCSNPLFNKIDTLIRYAIQSNLQSVMTDCPHREKLGWLEQTYLMGGSVQFNYELYHLYRKLVDDIMDSQRKDGLISSIAPEFVVFAGDFTDSPEWGSAIVILPWLFYRWYGDISVMKKAWPAMVSYVKYLDSKANDNILSYGLGDWYDLGPERPGYAQLSPKASTATAIYYFDYKLLSEMATLLYKKEEAIAFHRKAQEIKQAYNKLLFNPETYMYATGSQTAMAIPLSMGLVYEYYHAGVHSNLVDSIVANDKAITAGDIGFHYLIDALTKDGKSQLIYEMNNRDDVPGYGYQIKHGATALTESWQALRGVSNNHLMLGHILEWFYTGLGGIGQEENSGAYKMIIIKPAFIKGLDEVRTRYHTPYGYVKSEWKNTGTALEMHIEIPVNTEATVYLPVTDISRIIEGNRYLKELPKIKILGTEQNQLKVKIGSGNYNFMIIK
ncbi:MAG: family 78 glycoside hydrolase catalytic domain [Bacteroidales bacterium]|nr:family 78 glycoside hydrolase catalytic domain [Bacteroidales bacterium]